MGGVPAIESGVLIGSKRRLIGNDNYQRVLIVSRYTSSWRRPRPQRSLGSPCTASSQGVTSARGVTSVCAASRASQACGARDQRGSHASLTHRDAGNTPRHNRGVGAAGMRGVAFPGRGSGRPWSASRLPPRPHTPHPVSLPFPSARRPPFPLAFQSLPTTPFTSCH